MTQFFQILNNTMAIFPAATRCKMATGPLISVFSQEQDARYTISTLENLTIRFLLLQTIADSL